MFDGKWGVWDNPKIWTEAWHLRAYVNMWEITHDPDVLAALNELLQIVAAGNDRITGFPDQIIGTVMPGWGGTYGGTYGPHGGLRSSSICLNGLIMYPMAAFARIVRSEPSLNAQYGADAAIYLAQIDDIFQSFAPYRRNSTNPDGTISEFYTFPPGYIEDGIDFGGEACPYNQSLVPAEAIAEAWRVTNDAAYLQHAQRSGNWLWWACTYRYSGTTTWLVWPYTSISPSGMEDVSHATCDVLFAKTLCDAGIVSPWNAARIQYLASTFVNSVMGTSSTVPRTNVDGSGGPFPKPTDIVDWIPLRTYDINNRGNNDMAYLVRNCFNAAGVKITVAPPVLANFYRYGIDRPK